MDIKKPFDQWNEKKKDLHNRQSDLFYHEREIKHLLRPSVGVVEDKEARALLSQLRVVDTKRLIRKIGYLEKGIFEIIRKAVKDML